MTSKLKVGILSSCQHSMFSGGLANSTIALLESFKAIDCDVTFLNTLSSEWFDDCKNLKSEFNVVNIKKDEPILFDVMVELVPYFSSEAERKKFSNKCIAFHRKNILISTIEYSLYPIINTVMNYDGIDEVWCFDIVNSEEIQILETLTRKPIRILPYIWTPSIIQSHEKEVFTPLWISVQAQVASQNEGRLPFWSPHIVETNITNTSSCTIPVLTIREAKAKGFSVQKYNVHNAEHIHKSEFFRDNVYKHSQIEDLSSNYVGRQRLMDLVFEPMSCVISHVRFIDFKPMLFDLAWYGIPFIHNSNVLKDLPSFDRYYYPNNSISQAVNCLQTLHEDFLNGRGWFNRENVESVRNSILNRYGCHKILTVLKSSLDKLLTVTVEEPKKKKYVVLFTDMWDSMNSKYNFFTLMLKEANPSLDIEYYDERCIPTNVEPNLIIFGPFGNVWRSYPSVPKVHFTGENSPIVQDSNVKLNLGFQHADMVGEEYLRFPLWLLEIDWFNCDVDKIVNPKPIPLGMCTRVWSPEERKKFCAFIVSNPGNEIRNKSFEWLSEYKHVDSAGRLFNNTGDRIFATVAGGGGGELKKFEFLQDYKFALTYENSSSQGYTTEKLLHAKAAGCIPVYWGDPKVERDFNLDGCIDARNIKSKEELIELVKAVDTDDELYKKKMSVPALDACKVDWCRRTISECARRILNIMTGTSNSVERFIGTKKSFIPTVVKNSSSEILTPTVVTFATQEFLPSLNQWLAGIAAQRSAIKDLSAIVYLGSDVAEEPKKKLLETFPFITYKYLPTSCPDDFKDIWEPQHFAWKLYIYQDLCSSHKDKILFYMDAGSFLCRWPTEYLRLVQENDICVLTDEEQFNEQWCHDTFVASLSVTKDELEKSQIVGGIMAFRAGSEKATNYFNEAWRLGQKREIIVGEKWSGLRNGRPYGHRHDQSILSILSLRHNLAKYSLQNIYCDTSLRRTFITNKHLYVHRGLFKIHESFTDGIDECFVINLKRRKDRMDKLYTNNPELKNRAIQSTAFEGVNLQLTEALYRLFKPHDFMWKKAIMGCALSHLNLWYQLVNEKPDIQNYLILEDDVKLQKGWEAKWKEALPHIPENYDIIYLGGILPPNREGFEASKDPINKYFSRVKDNNFYGQQVPNRYFHFCAYAYVLSKQGAEKVIATLMARDGYYTSADHILCNPIDFFNIYFLDPLVAGCYQDDDPTYANSQFNNFNRVDKFDSDLWNNDERFTEEEIKSVTNTKELDILKALHDAKTTSKKDTLIKEPLNKIVTTLKKVTLYSLQKISWKDLYEKRWLEELFGHPDIIEVEQVDEGRKFTGETPIFLLMRPHLEEYSKLFSLYESVGQPFKVLHLSDEFCNDPIEFYNYSSCKMVLRNYVRDNLPSNVTVIPLGYHHTSKQGIEKPYERTPQLPFRSYMWSFFGTRWNDRDKLLEPLKSVQEHRCELYDEWNDKNSLGEKEYLSVLLNSWCVPCIGGNNPETYRFYEALECGSVPILVEDESNREFIKYITNFLPIVPIKSYEQAPNLLEGFKKSMEIFEQYRYSVLNAYSSMKKHFQDKSKELLN